MDLDEENQLRKAKLFFGAYFPGLVERLERLEGTFLPLPYPPRYIKPFRPGTRALKMPLAYRVRKRDVRVDIRLTLEILEVAKAAVRGNILNHSYHLGPYASPDEYIIRLCDNGTQPYHFHLRGWEMVYDGGHIPANRADPPLSSDPFAFLAVVEHFIETNQIQIQVKK